MKPEAGTVRQNVLYSLVDYVSQPAIMIVAAPFLLKTLGTQQYGTWMLVNAIAAAASGIGGGFGDGATRYISLYRGRDDREGALRSLLAVLVVNGALGLLSAIAMVVAAPILIGRLFPVDPTLRHAGIVALRISAVVLLLRFVEAVFTAAVKGCEKYQPVVAIAVITRSLATLAAIVLAMQGYGLVAILWATLVAAMVSASGQGWLACGVLHAGELWRKVDIRAGVHEVFRFGAFTWLKSTLGVFLAYGDRLLVAALLGTGPLAFYTLCNQLTQPIHALIAAGFNFVFPHLSARSAAGRRSEALRSYRMAMSISICVVAAIGLPMMAGAHFILRVWLGAAYAEQYHRLLIAMIAGNGLLAITVVPHYAALALGRSRALALVNLVAGAVSMGGGYLLLARFGIVGGGLAKILAGMVFTSLFWIARSAFRDPQARPAASGATTAPRIQLDPAADRSWSSPAFARNSNNVRTPSHCCRLTK
jgi:O-antigen/teichoic acid export membrane protein